jgi:hypothetical protein
VIAEICARRRDDVDCARLVVVASTGVAALNVNGQTLHKFAGCGVPRRVSDFEKMWAKETRQRWRDVETLIFDEISMTSGTFLDALSKVVTEIRAPSRRYGGAKTWRPHLPFGGIQLILCGDFLQLPPVFARESTSHVMRVQAASDVVPFHNRGELSFIYRYILRESCSQFDSLPLTSSTNTLQGFAFESAAWKSANLTAVVLRTNHRAGNEAYAALLRKIRLGHVDVAVMRALHPLTVRKARPAGIVAMKLVATNRESSVINADELEKLDASTHVNYTARDAVHPDPVHPDDKDRARGAKAVLWKSAFWDECLARKTVELRLGASVMLLKNHATNRKLVNGSQGTVVGFKRNPSIAASGDDAAQAQGADHKLYPLVSFKCVDGDESDTIIHLAAPETFDYELPCFGRCVRVQVPLKLAWASTTHKAQGLSITYLDIDLGRFWGDGQACAFPSSVFKLRCSLSITRAPLTFLAATRSPRRGADVALSRARDPRHVEVHNLRLEKFKTNRKAREFHAKLAAAPGDGDGDGGSGGGGGAAGAASGSDSSSGGAASAASGSDSSDVGGRKRARCGAAALTESGATKRTNADEAGGTTAQPLSPALSQRRRLRRVDATVARLRGFWESAVMEECDFVSAVVRVVRDEFGEVGSGGEGASGDGGGHRLRRTRTPTTDAVAQLKALQRRGVLPAGQFEQCVVKLALDASTGGGGAASNARTRI